MNPLLLKKKYNRSGFLLPEGVVGRREGWISALIFRMGGMITKGGLGAYHN